jgi:hypothetical protein
VEPHVGGYATDAAIHLGNGDGAQRLSLDLIE